MPTVLAVPNRERGLQGRNAVWMSSWWPAERRGASRTVLAPSGLEGGEAGEQQRAGGCGEWASQGETDADQETAHHAAVHLDE